MPNWVTCTWPDEHHEVVQWQWEKVLIPYWKEQAKIASDHGVKVALEMHAGMSVYNPGTAMRLREACGKSIGVNLDPSHMAWQGMDIPLAIKYLGEAVHFVHAKDTVFNKDAVNVHGVLVNDRNLDERTRPWYFRTVGYGQIDFKALISMLRVVGYDHALSIEHEDSLMTPKEGLEKAVAYLKSIMIMDASKNKHWW
jgi:sugar phosphate isomerase/epimerase